MNGSHQTEQDPPVIRECPCGQEFVALSSYVVHMGRHHPEVDLE